MSAKTGGIAYIIFMLTLANVNFLSALAHRVIQTGVNVRPIYSERLHIIHIKTED